MMSNNTLFCFTNSKWHYFPLLLVKDNFREYFEKIAFTISKRDKSCLPMVKSIMIDDSSSNDDGKEA